MKTNIEDFKKTLNNDDPYCYKMDCGKKVDIQGEFCDIHKDKGDNKMIKLSGIMYADDLQFEVSGLKPTKENTLNNPFLGGEAVEISLKDYNDYKKMAIEHSELIERHKKLQADFNEQKGEIK